MSEANKQIARRFFEEAVNKRRPEILDELLAKSYVSHQPGGLTIEGPAAARANVEGWLQGVPDAKVTVEQEIAEGAFVASRLRAGGTQSGTLMGISPTNRRAEISMTHIVRIQRGKIVEDWMDADYLSYWAQLGVIELPSVLQQAMQPA